MIHYLILAHNNLDQLGLLVNKLKTKNSKIYIHLDKKIKDFEKIKDVKYIKDRQSINWGGTKMVKAELIGLNEIQDEMERGDHVIIISGQCYPIKSIKHIEEYIEELGDKSCISYEVASGKILERVTKYHFFDINFHTPSFINEFLINFLSYFKKFDRHIKVPVINVIIGEIISLILPKRKGLTKIFDDIYWGQSWMVLSYSHVKYLQDFIKSERGKKVLKGFRNTANNDEIFFQTVLVSRERDKINNKSLWFTSWEDGAASPNYLTIDDLEEIKKSDKLFARKFDITKDRKIIEKLSEI